MRRLLDLRWPEPLCRRLADAGLRVVRYDNRDTGHSTYNAQFRNPDAFDPEASIARVTAELERTDNIQTAFNHATIQTEQDWTRRLADVTTPTLIIHGDLDSCPLRTGGQWSPTEPRAFDVSRQELG